MFHREFSLLDSYYSDYLGIDLIDILIHLVIHSLFSDTLVSILLGKLASEIHKMFRNMLNFEHTSWLLYTYFQFTLLRCVVNSLTGHYL
jgi:DNA integrity scanning protein DisA with diadenylate cyclase activity